jgi:hypothetical protein
MLSGRDFFVIFGINYPSFHAWPRLLPMNGSRLHPMLACLVGFNPLILMQAPSRLLRTSDSLRPHKQNLLKEGAMRFYTTTHKHYCGITHSGRVSWRCQPDSLPWPVTLPTNSLRDQTRTPCRRRQMARSVFVRRDNNISPSSATGVLNEMGHGAELTIVVHHRKCLNKVEQEHRGNTNVRFCNSADKLRPSFQLLPQPSASSVD